MKKSAPLVIMPLVGGGLSAWLIALTKWSDLRPSLLPALSIIAAAVLVRLARGLPFTNADHFTLEQFRSVARNLEQNARKLRALIFVCLIAIALLIMGGEMVSFLQKRLYWVSWVGPVASKTLSGLLAVTIVYAFTRIIEVVHSDIGLLRTQAKILEGVIAAKNAASFEKSIKDEVRPGIAGASGYGKRVPH